MAKRKSKYNPLKRATRLAQTATKNFAIVWFAGGIGQTGSARIWDLKNDCEVTLPTKDFIEILFQYPYMWATDLLVLGRVQHSREEYCQVTACVPLFVKQKQIEKSVSEHMERLVKEANPLQRVNKGWIYNTTGENLTDAQLQRIILYYDAWNFETILERDIRIKEETEDNEDDSGKQI